MIYEQYLNRDKFKLVDLLPYAISYLEIYEKSNGIDLAIYTDDSNECFIHLRVATNDYSINEKHLQEIHKHLENHCCKCGSQENVTQYYFDCYLCAWSGIVICEECIAKEKGLLEYLFYQIKKQSNINSYKANHIKVKLRTEDNHLIYRFAEEIWYENGKFFIYNSLNPQKKECVKIIGQSIGLRDVSGERVYEGDIILAEDNNGIRFYGMIKKGNSGWKSDSFPNPQWDKFMLIHGYGSFPSSLAFATKFKIIGSIGTIKNYNEDIHREHCMETWILENKDLDMSKVHL